MAVVTTNLGIVTAYGYARQRGYTGTEAEFAQLLLDYTDIATLTENISEIVAEDYDSTVVYTTGDFVLYDGLLRVCIAEDSTTGNFDVTKWSEVSVGNVLKSYSESVATISATITDVVHSTDVANIVKLSSGEYEALPEKNSNTLYIIEG